MVPLLILMALPHRNQGLVSLKQFIGICLSFIMLEAGNTPENVTSFHFQSMSFFPVDEFLLLVHKGSISLCIT